MKVGIITVYDSANFGSYLQAFALKSAIEKLGHDVKFIKVRSEKEVKEVFFGTIRHPKYFIKNYIFNKKKYKLFLEDREVFKEIPQSDVKINTFDVVIIGSDELWNVKMPVFTKKCFYGINIPTKRKIAFAISSGKALPEDYLQYQDLIDGMKQLEDIYVRDEQTKNNIKELLNKDCKMVCDPTFLIDVNDFEKDYNVPINKKYLLVYSYDFTNKQQEYIRKFADEKNLLVVSACFNHKFCDICINCSPLQFCKMIQKSEYVVTTTFHGTIFSILNKKQFISIPASQKVKDVLGKLKMEDCEFNDNESNYEDFKKKLLSPKQFTQSEEQLLKWRSASMDILKNILKVKE